jgi:hypothetical protein
MRVFYKERRLPRDACGNRDEAIMARTTVMRLTWGGRETAAEVIEAVARGVDVEIALPLDMHHALFRRLHPDANAAELERVEVANGVELLRTLAGMAGLEAMAQLEEPLKRANYRVELRSPGPLLSLVPPQLP